MNNRVLVALATAGMLSLSVPTFAQSGVYVGGQLGWGNTNYGLDATFTDGTDFVNINSGDENGVAGRIYLGYQFNCYFGLEVGAALFSNTDLNINVNNGEAVVNLGDIETSQFDLLLKVGMPFGCSGFRGDVKIGIADVVTSFDSNFDFNNGQRFDNDSDSNINFALGASVSYNINRCVAVDLSWLHTFGNTPNNDNFNFDRDWSPNTDLVTVGVSYTFL